MLLLQLLTNCKALKQPTSAHTSSSHLRPHVVVYLLVIHALRFEVLLLYSALLAQLGARLHIVPRRPLCVALVGIDDLAQLVGELLVPLQDGLHRQETGAVREAAQPQGPLQPLLLT